MTSGQTCPWLNTVYSHIQIGDTYTGVWRQLGSVQYVQPDRVNGLFILQGIKVHALLKCFDSFFKKFSTNLIPPNRQYHHHKRSDTEYV